MRVLIILLFFFFNSPRKVVDIIDKQHNIYHAGVRKGGMGANYQIKLVANKSSDKLQFSSIVTQCDTLKATVYNTHFEPIKTFVKGDTLVIRASDFMKDKSAGNCLNNPEIKLIIEIKKSIHSLPIILNKTEPTYGV